jgi:hypothetical protein
MFEFIDENKELSHFLATYVSFSRKVSTVSRLQFTYNGEMRMFIGFETIFYPQQG